MKNVRIDIPMTDTIIKCRVTLTNDDGTEKLKTVSVSNLLNMLDSSIEKKETVEYVHIGKLPNGYVDGCVAADDTYKVAIRVPGAQRPYNYMGMGCNKLFLMPFPETLFLFKVVEGVLRDSFCYAVTSDGFVARWPYANVYDSHSICWGSNVIPPTTFGTSHELAEFFLSSGFNTHLSTRNTKLDIDDIEGLIRYLTPMEEFPEDILLKQKKTVDEVVRGFLK